jgi:CRP-like cAMP-binding protein
MSSTATPRNTVSAVHCLLCGKAGPSPLCCLGPEHVARHTAAGRIQTYLRGQPIFHAGNVPFALYGLLDGAVKVSATTTGGTTLILRVVGAGDILGYRPLLAGEKYAVTAESIATTKVAAIPRDDIFAALRRSPDTALWFLAKLARELRISEEQMVACMYLPVRRRTARLLVT